MKREIETQIKLNKSILQDYEINSLIELKKKILESYIPRYLVNSETNTLTAIMDDDVKNRLSKIDLWIKERIETIMLYYS